MTYKYCLVRRAIYENDPTSKLKKRRSLKDMKRLFKLPFWIMMFLVICSLISIALILLFKFNTMLVSIPYFVIALVSFVFEIPREDKIYHMEERNKEIRIKECEYEEYINNVREILTELGVNTPNKIEKLKEECEEILIKRNNRFSNINNRIIDMLIGVPLGALIASTMVEIRQLVWVDFSCVIIKHLTFCIIQSFISFLCILIYLAITDALESACFFKSRTESADTCKDIKIFYQYESSPFRFFKQKNGQAFFKT